MAHITWSDIYNTTIEEIDNQNKQLFDHINKLNNARLLTNRKTIAQVIDGLTEYIISHFAFEKILMEGVSYTFAKSHQNIYQAFTKRSSTFKGRFNAGEDVAEEFQNLVKTWLVQHIQQDNAAYVRAIRPKMLALLESKGATNGSFEGEWLLRSMKKFFGK